jgi:CRP/FNR family nitrogen fixation transcriptional regulator
LSCHPLARPKYDQRPCGLIALVGSSTPEVAPIGFDRNACVYRQGDPVGRLYKIVVGAVRACRVLADGRRQIGAFYLPGDIFAETNGPGCEISIPSLPGPRIGWVNPPHDSPCAA